MEGICKSGVRTLVLLALVQNGPMDQNQIAWKITKKKHQLTYREISTLVRLPGSQHSSTYSPVDGRASLVGTNNCSKPVPPVGRRTKRFVMGVVKCDPGRNERAPFSAVHFSRGIQNPRADGGSVYYLRESGRHGKSREIHKSHTRNVLHAGQHDESRLTGEVCTHESLCSGTIIHTRVPRSGNEVRSLWAHADEFEKGVTFSADLLLFRDDHGLERCECAAACIHLVSPALTQGCSGSLSRTYRVAVEF